MSADTALTITAVGGLITALTGATIAIIHEIRSARRETKADTESVHRIVNQQRTDMMAEIEALKRMVRSEGGDPDDAT